VSPALRPLARACALAGVLLGATVGSGAVAVAQRAPARSQTSCSAIAHIGDSLSVGMDSSASIPDPDARIGGQYEAIGATDVRLDISGARSVVEHLDGRSGGEEAARRLRREGFEGCWVIALGTNDAANVDAGSGYGFSERIDRMMAIIGDDPVLWVDVKTLKESGHYAGENMRRFNTALSKAHARYPALRVYDWSAVAQDDWFASDGIHYTAGGYTYFDALISAAVADAFPATDD
jgi:hypothetical protein